MLNPPLNTPPWVVRRLEAGQPVPLDAPGWADTTRKPCPDCQRLVMGIRWAPHVFFEYGVAHAHGHICNQPVPPEDHPHFLALERVRKELDEVRQQHEAEAQVRRDVEVRT